MDKELLLAEVEDLLRNIPLHDGWFPATPENFAWLGRASALIAQWNPSKDVQFASFVAKAQSSFMQECGPGMGGLMVMLHQARNDLRMTTLGPLAVAIGHGMAFDYFDEVRKIIETATQDVFFVDPYLDAEFVSRYLPNVSKGVAIRLLARERLPSLLPAVDAFVQQNDTKIQVRSSEAFHDRYVLIDKGACYQSGASFKDGAKKAPTTLAQISDAFPAVSRTYEELWDRAKIDR